jgi:hypothetical protein
MALPVSRKEGRHDYDGDTDRNYGAVEFAIFIAPHLVRSSSR